MFLAHDNHHFRESERQRIKEDQGAAVNRIPDPAESEAETGGQLQDSQAAGRKGIFLNAIMSGPASENNEVFLNVPYTSGYETQFVALVSTVVAAGLIPRCALEVAEHGEGQLKRVVELIRQCRLSIHDLSLTRHLNMPFELGISVAFKFSQPGEQRGFILLDAKPGRLAQVLSDMKGREPIIHANRPLRLIAGLVQHLEGMTPQQVEGIYRKLRGVLPELKRKYRTSNVFQRRVFQELVSGALELATGAGLLAE